MDLAYQGLQRRGDAPGFPTESASQARQRSMITCLSSKDDGRKTAGIRPRPTITIDPIG